jgi:hypothetical protein
VKFIPVSMIDGWEAYVQLRKLRKEIALVRKACETKLLNMILNGLVDAEEARRQQLVKLLHATRHARIGDTFVRVAWQEAYDTLPTEDQQAVSAAHDASSTTIN